MNEVDDKHISEKLAKGDMEAFRELVNLHQNQVVNMCYRFLLNRQDAEDVAQDVFHEVYQSISSFRGDCKLSTWIYRISVNRSMDHLRKEKRQKRGGIFKRLLGLDDVGDTIQAPQYLQPDQQLENREQMIALKSAMETLSGNQQIAFTLKHVEGFSQKEIAEVLGLSVSAVESLITRGKNNLKKYLQNYFEKKE